MFDKVKNSPTTEYVKDKMSIAHQKVRGFIDKRVHGRSGDFKFNEDAADARQASKS
jgi:hypothetical protein